MFEIARKLTRHESSAARANELFENQRQKIYRNTDQLFAKLMLLQWLAAVLMALVISPYTWAGQSSAIHIHVWAAIFLGGAISLFPIWMTRAWPGAAVTRQVIAVAQMLMSALLISVTGGRIETHFHVFGSLVILSFYRDWRVLIPATIVVGLDHFIRGIYWPYSVYGVLTASPWRSIEHAAWVAFEDIFLVISCLRSIREMRSIANRAAALEASERSFRQIFEEAPIGMAIVDLDYRFVRVNAAMCELVGYSEQELTQRRTLDITFPEDVELTRQTAQDLLNGVPSCSFQKRYVRKDNEVIWIGCTVCSIESDGEKPRYYLGMVEDISERKRAEEEVYKLNRVLEQRVQERTAGFQAANRELRNEVAERKRAEEALRESEGTLAQAQRIAQLGYWERDLDTDHIIWSEETYRIFGLPPGRTPDFAEFKTLIHDEDRHLVLQAIVEALRGGPRYEMEYRVVWPNGEVHFVHSQGDVMKDESGRPRRMFGTAQDITQRKRAEEESRLMQTMALAIGEAKDVRAALGMVLHNVCEVTGWVLGQAWIPRPDESVLECSAAWGKDGAGMETFRAVSRGKTFAPGVGLPGRVWASKQLAWLRDVTLDTNFPRAQAAREAGLKAAIGVPVMADEEVIAVIEFFVRESREEDERFVKLISSVVAQLGQIVERKRLEESLRASEERFRSLVQSANDAIVLADDRGSIVSWNKGAQAIFGYRDEEVLGKPLTTLMPERYREAHGKGMMRFRTTGESRVIGKTVELQGLRKDGSEFPLELSLASWGTETDTFFSGIIRDITERKQAEEALRQAEQKYRAIYENAAEGIFQTTPEGRYISVNPALARMYGYSSPEELTESVDDIGHILYVSPERRTEFKRLIEAEGSVEGFEYEVYRKDGSRIWLSENARAVRDASGAVIYYEGAVQDITERKRVEERLLEQADIINRAQNAIIIRNFEDECITFWNKGAEQLYGWSAKEAVGKPIGELISADAKDREAPLKLLISTGEFHGEIKHCARDGREVVVDSRVTLIRNDDGTPRSVLGINTDITERKKLEMQLLRAQRLESIGTLASGVAHDLNNILTPILMCAQTLRGDLADEDRQSAISLIEESAQRGAGVVKQVLTFARGIEGERVLIKSSHLIEEMIDIARQTFPKSIELSSNYSEDLWSIEGDPTELHQVLLNLCVNARDAMPNGGSLTLAGENFTADEHYAAMAPDAKVGPYVVLRVSDSGAGMTRATIDKIFDPFFTTKEVGKGTGLGLSTTLGIVKSHGGFISVYSEIGKGTTFKLFLPAAMTDANLQPSQISVVPIQGNGELILVVDDEPNILEITKMIFEKHNYRIVSASDGLAALALFAQQMESIGGLLTDIAMPYMDGVALVRALRKMKSDLPIIASTGQGEQARVNELRSLNVHNFLSKPYDTDKLLTTIQAALEGRPTEPSEIEMK